MKSIEEIHEALMCIHRLACGTSDRAYMSVPADPQRDADLIVSAAIDELALLRAQNKAAREECSEILKYAMTDQAQNAAERVLGAMDGAKP